MAEFKDYPIAMLIIGIFVVAVMSFSIGIGKNYGKSSSQMTTEYIDYARIENQLNETAEDAKAYEQSFKSDNIFAETGALILFSIFGIGKLIFGTVRTFFWIYLDIFANLFGIPPLITSILTAIIIITLIFALYRQLRQGS